MNLKVMIDDEVVGTAEGVELLSPGLVSIPCLVIDLDSGLTRSLVTKSVVHLLDEDNIFVHRDGIVVHWAGCVSGKDTMTLTDVRIKTPEAAE